MKKIILLSIITILASCSRNGLVKESKDGYISECEYKDDVKNGQCKYYWEDSPNDTEIRTYLNGEISSPTIYRYGNVNEYEEVDFFDYVSSFDVSSNNELSEVLIPKTHKLIHNDLELIKVVYNTDSLLEKIKKEEANKGQKFGDGWSYGIFFDAYNSFIDSIIIDSSFIEKLYEDELSNFYNNLESTFNKWELTKPTGFPIDIRNKFPETFRLESILCSKEVSRNDSTIKYSIIARSENTIRTYPISFLRKNSNLYWKRLFVLDGNCKTQNMNGEIIRKTKYKNGHRSNQNALYALYGF